MPVPVCRRGKNGKEPRAVPALVKREKKGGRGEDRHLARVGMSSEVDARIEDGVAKLVGGRGGVP